MFDSHSYFFERLYTLIDPATVDFALLQESKSQDGVAIWWAGLTQATTLPIDTAGVTTNLSLGTYSEWINGAYGLTLGLVFPGIIPANYEWKPSFQAIWDTNGIYINASWNWNVIRPYAGATTGAGITISSVQIATEYLTGYRTIVLQMLQSELDFTKTRGWGTSIQSGMTGQEQRISYMTSVARSYSLRFMAYEGTSQARERLHLMPHFALMVPYWPDYVELTAAAGVAATVLQVQDDLTNREYAVGGYVMLMDRAGMTVNIRTISAITAGQLTLSAGLSNSFGFADYVIPAYLCQPVSNIRDEQARGHYIEAKLDVREI